MKQLRSLELVPSGAQDAELFRYPQLLGRLCEVHGEGGGLTLAASFVREAQHLRQPVAWVSSHKTSFYAPDVLACGIDLEALVCVRVNVDKHKQAIARSADQLLRSGAFGLVVADLEDERAEVTSPLLMRLSALVRQHESALVFLRSKTKVRRSLGSLISLRIEAVRDDDEHILLSSTKDKKRAPFQRSVLKCRPPPGFKKRFPSRQRLELVKPQADVG